MIHKETKLADLIYADVFTLSILERLNIQLGFEDKTIFDICEELNLNDELFIDIINLFIHGIIPDNFKNKNGKYLLDLIEYLKTTHKYYLSYKIPQIEKLIHQIELSETDRNEDLNLLNNFFKNYKIEFIKHIENEEEQVFPYIVELFLCHVSNNFNNEILTKIKEQPISNFEKEHDNLDEKLNDLKNLIVKYFKPFKNWELVHQILVILFELEKDVYEHAQLEDLILIPIVQSIEQTPKELSN